MTKGKRGKSTKSPRFKHGMKREAEKNEVRSPRTKCKAKTVKELRKSRVNQA